MTTEKIDKIRDHKERFRLRKENGYIGSISEDERRRALNGERIDHHLTDDEAQAFWSVENKNTFNKMASPNSYSSLYAWRHDKELADYYASISFDFPIIPIDNISDFRVIADPSEL